MPEEDARGDAMEKIKIEQHTFTGGLWFAGTGKFEGAKGKETYKGRVGAGGLRTYNSEGEIELAK